MFRLPVLDTMLYVLLPMISGTLTSELPARECPSPSTVVDLVVGRCAALFIGGMPMEGDKCS